ncbi:specific transcriptional repressor [Coprinopsis cinerea AmutBmut pab1-1]|nr:specific transcriptional repressor [Coprinopsis cinerea AmutBmut pab1-1]
MSCNLSASHSARSYRHREDNESISPLGQPSSFASNEYREVPLSKSLRRVDSGQPYSTSIVPLSPASLKAASPSPKAPDSPTTPTAATSDSTPCTKPLPSASTSASRPHVPRPPNAFMIYRSELVKTRAVPPEIEHRQQNLSRLAGQCWNLLPQHEKDKYHQKAKEALLEHQRLNPDYKFTPAPRGSRKAKTKAQQAAASSNVNSSERIRAIREQYVKVLGPSLVASRKRKRKSRGGSADDADTLRHQDLPLLGDQTPLVRYHGRSSPQPAHTARSISGDYSSLVHPSFSRASLPRRPSTSLGFSTGSSVQPTFNHSIFFESPRHSPCDSSDFSLCLQGVSEVAPNQSGNSDIEQLNFFQMPSISVNAGFSFPPAPAPDFNSLTSHHECDEISPFTQPVLQMPLQHQSQPTAPQERMYRSDMVRMDGRSDGRVESVTLPNPGDNGTYEDWKILHNPSDELNYTALHLNLPHCGTISEPSR